MSTCEKKLRNFCFEKSCYSTYQCWVCSITYVVCMNTATQICEYNAVFARQSTRKASWLCWYWAKSPEAKAALCPGQSRFDNEDVVEAAASNSAFFCSMYWICNKESSGAEARRPTNEPAVELGGRRQQVSWWVISSTTTGYIRVLILFKKNRLVFCQCPGFVLK